MKKKLLFILLSTVLLFLFAGLFIWYRNIANKTVHQAVYDGDYMALSIALKRGDDINAKCKVPIRTAEWYFWNIIPERHVRVHTGLLDNTPLHLATHGNDLQMVQHLIKEGADVDATDRSGHTPLLSPVMWGYTEVARLLVESGCDVNAGPDSWTPLYFAVREGHVDIVRLLVRNGANPQQLTPERKSILQFAKDLKRAEIVTTLQEISGK